MIDIGTCCRCKCKMAIPVDLYNAAHRSSAIQFYCAYGHPQHFIEGETEEQKLRRERDRLKQETARLEDEARVARARADKAETANKRLKKRAAAGTCPCCSRTFQNMATHLKRQHPEFVCETEANVVPLKKVRA